jgi:hypothetical protein
MKRIVFRTAPGLLFLGVALLGCHQAQQSFTDTQPDQVVVQVNGIS